MEYLIIAMNNPELSDKLRTYSLYKSPSFFGYGIAFHTESIQPSLPSHKLVYPLIEIEPDSPAEEAGMKNGQRVVAVNGEFVNRDFATLEDVVQGIEDSYYSRNFTDITVLDPLLWNDLMENPLLAAKLASYSVVKQPARIDLVEQHKPEPVVNQLVDAILAQPIEHHTVVSPVDKALPRLCRLSRQAREDQYGFDFKTLKNEGKHVANNVRPGYPADKAGLRDGDYILEVNGQSVDGIEHDAVVNKISSNPKQVDLLVVSDLNAYLVKQRPVRDQSSDQYNVEISIPHFKPANEISYHRVKLIPGYKGLGISLTPNGIINAIEPNSPSDKAGLKKDYRIVEVNSVDVKDKSNKEIAALIRQHENDLVIGVLKTPEDQFKSAQPAREPSPVRAAVEDVLIGSKLGERPKTPSASEANQSISSASGKKISGMLSF